MKVLQSQLKLFFSQTTLYGVKVKAKLDRLSMRAEQFREITGRFLLNELGDPNFFNT